MRGTKQVGGKQWGWGAYHRRGRYRGYTRRPCRAGSGIWTRGWGDAFRRGTSEKGRRGERKEESDRIKKVKRRYKTNARAGSLCASLSHLGCVNAPEQLRAPWHQCSSRGQPRSDGMRIRAHGVHEANQRSPTPGIDKTTNC